MTLFLAWCKCSPKSNYYYQILWAQSWKQPLKRQKVQDTGEASFPLIKPKNAGFPWEGTTLMPAMELEPTAKRLQHVCMAPRNRSEAFAAFLSLGSETVRLDCPQYYFAVLSEAARGEGCSQYETEQVKVYNACPKYSFALLGIKCGINLYAPKVEGNRGFLVFGSFGPHSWES